MVRLRNGLAMLASLGLVAAAPASAAIRPAQALPAASASTDSTALARASQPLVEASALSNEDDGFSPAIIVALVAVILAVLLAASGGGGGGPDSPG